jgi:nucleoside-triphosphatase THEP1
VSRINLLTGEIASGKTTICLGLAEAARQKGFRLGGLLSPAVFEGGEKTAIDVLDLKTSRRKRLAELKSSQSSGLETIRWAFQPEAVEWGNQALLQALPCDLLLIDELGPLEFNRGEGWVKGFEVIEGGEYLACLVVVRPSLLDEAKLRWEVSQTIDLGHASQSSLMPEALLDLLIGE